MRNNWCWKWDTWNIRCRGSRHPDQQIWFLGPRYCHQWRVAWRLCSVQSAEFLVEPAASQKNCILIEKLFSDMKHKKIITILYEWIWVLTAEHDILVLKEWESGDDLFCAFEIWILGTSLSPTCIGIWKNYIRVEQVWFHLLFSFLKKREERKSKIVRRRAILVVYTQIGSI